MAAGQLLAAQPHVGEYALADVQRGAQLFSTRCTSCHGAAGDQVPGVRLLSGRFRRASSDDDLAALIRDGIADAGMPPGAYSPEELTALVSYLRSVAVDPSATADAPTLSTGDPQHGSRLFHGRAECSTCHRVRGVGGFRGPNLCTAPGFLDSGLTVFASTLPRPARRGRVAPGRGFDSRISPASTVRCMSA